MSSSQHISDANNGNLESWEKELWASVPSTEPNISKISENCDVQYQFSDTPNVKVISRQSFTPEMIFQGYQMQTCTAYQTSESSSSFSPTTWEDSALDISPKSTMSTYFSTFNPSAQFVQSSVQLSPVTRTSPNLMTQNTSGNGKMHHAHINFVPPENGTLKAIGKRKRKRTVFTTEQLEVLEAIFIKKPYVARDERQALVQQLQVNDKSIKVWFQNRRLKNKRGDDKYEVMQDSSKAIFKRLDTLEAHINERTNELDYVTLDDELMSELVNVIDDYFSTNALRVETKSESDNYPIYEPISPASPVASSDYSGDENFTNRLLCESNNSTQYFI